MDSGIKKNVILLVSSKIKLDYNKELYDNVKIVNLDLPLNDLFKEVWNGKTGLVPIIRVVEKDYYKDDRKRLKHVLTDSSFTPKDNVLTDRAMDAVLEELYSWDNNRIYSNTGYIHGSLSTISKFEIYRDEHGMNDISQTGGKLVSY